MHYLTVQPPCSNFRATPAKLINADRMANSVDPDQTAPLEAVWSGSSGLPRPVCPRTSDYYGTVWHHYPAPVWTQKLIYIYHYQVKLRFHAGTHEMKANVYPAWACPRPTVARLVVSWPLGLINYLDYWCPGAEELPSLRTWYQTVWMRASSNLKWDNYIWAKS